MGCAAHVLLIMFSFKDAHADNWWYAIHSLHIYMSSIFEAMDVCSSSLSMDHHFRGKPSLILIDHVLFKQVFRMYVEYNEVLVTCQDG